MRMLPLLAVQRKAKDIQSHEVFWFWNQNEQATKLLTLFYIYAHSCEFNSSLHISESNYNITGAYLSASFNTVAAIEGVIYSGCKIIDLIKSSTMPNISTAEIVSSAVYSVSRAGIEDDFIHEITNDLTNINITSLKEFLSSPLWSGSFPDNWKSLLNDFKNDANWFKCWFLKYG